MVSMYQQCIKMEQQVSYHTVSKWRTSITSSSSEYHQWISGHTMNREEWYHNFHRMYNIYHTTNGEWITEWRMINIILVSDKNSHNSRQPLKNNTGTIANRIGQSFSHTSVTWMECLFNGSQPPVQPFQPQPPAVTAPRRRGQCIVMYIVMHQQQGIGESTMDR